MMTVGPFRPANDTRPCEAIGVDQILSPLRIR